MKTVTAHTHANVSLIKYWGKRDEALLLPTKSSISFALDALKTKTSVRFSHDNQDRITFNHVTPHAAGIKKITDFLDIFRTLFNINKHFIITTANSFPTAAGLASSSSGFAALAMALNKLCNLNLSHQELSVLARRGSGSACRSVYGGFMIWHQGQKPDGSDCFAEKIFDELHWPELRVLIVVINDHMKKVSSRDGARITTATSPSYQQWLKSSAQRIPHSLTALQEKNFTSIARLAQDDWNDMQRSMLDSTPQLDYWTARSHAVMKSVETLNDQGISCFFTTEAGPNVKIITFEKHEALISHYLKKLDPTLTIIPSRIAGDPVIIEE